MPNSTYFIQACPTCGRPLRIRVGHLGRRLVCQHCQGKFVARDPASATDDGHDPENALLRRAEELLESVDRLKAENRSPYPR